MLSTWSSIGTLAAPNSKLVRQSNLNTTHLLHIFEYLNFPKPNTQLRNTVSQARKMSNINAAYANINANNLRALQQQLSFEKESKLKKHQKLVKYDNENSSNSKELAFALNQIATTERQSLLLSLSYELSEVPSSLI